MNVSALHRPPFAPANSRPPSATPPAADPPATDPGEKPAHGLVGGAGDSHRSSVAALRQWINHPERRAEMGTPDLTATHHGKGFEKAVAAYQAAIAGAPTVTDPAPTTPPESTTPPPPNPHPPPPPPRPPPPRRYPPPSRSQSRAGSPHSSTQPPNLPADPFRDRAASNSRSGDVGTYPEGVTASGESDSAESLAAGGCRDQFQYAGWT